MSYHDLFNQCGKLYPVVSASIGSCFGCRSDLVLSCGSTVAKNLW